MHEGGVSAFQRTVPTNLASWLARAAGGRVWTVPRCPVAGRGKRRLVPGLRQQATPVVEAARLPNRAINPRSTKSTTRQHKLRRCPQPAFPNARVRRAGFVDADWASAISRSGAKKDRSNHRLTCARPRHAQPLGDFPQSAWDQSPGVARFSLCGASRSLSIR